MDLDPIVEQAVEELEIPPVMNPMSEGEMEKALIGIRRHLHMNPEVGLEEVNTSRYIREVLVRNGMSPSGALARTGLYVDIVGDYPGPVVAYRADIDALPIQDRKEVPYASTNAGIAHLCGHDAHTTIALGAAVLLNAHRAQLKGTVRIFFQPNEEGIPSGAPLMIADHVLDGVSAVIASHVDPTLAVGRYGLIKGAATASADRFRVVVSGPSTGHSARPHQTADTVWILTQIMSALYQVIGRRTDARNSAVLAICRLRAGDAYNVIPEFAEFGGTLRCTVAEDRAFIRHLIRETASSVAQLHGAAATVDFDIGAPPVVNDARLVRLVRETVHRLYGEEAVYDIPLPSMGAEDFSHYLDHVPGMLLRVGTSSGPETSHVLHDASFDIDEKALLLTSRLIANVLVDYLEAA